MFHYKFIAVVISLININSTIPITIEYSYDDDSCSYCEEDNASYEPKNTCDMSDQSDEDELFIDECSDEDVVI